MPDRKNLGTYRQAVSVLQFSKSIRYSNGTEHPKENHVGFLLSNALCVSVGANAQEGRQT